MRKTETALVKTAKEELDERFSIPKHSRKRSTSSIISHSGHSIVVSKRARAAHQTNAYTALQSIVFPNGVQWCRPSPSLPLLSHSRSSPCLPFHDLFVRKIDGGAVICPPPPWKAVLLTEQCFNLNESDDDDDSMFYKPSLREK